MKATVILLCLVSVALFAQEKPLPSMLLGAITNTDRAAIQFEMFGPNEAGYLTFFFGTDFKEHELRGIETPSLPATGDLTGHFPLRIYQAGLLYSHIIRSVATVGVGVQYREYHEHAEFSMATVPVTYGHFAEWYVQRFDFAATAGWIFGAWLHASLTYTTRGEILIGATFALR